MQNFKKLPIGMFIGLIVTGLLQAQTADLKLVDWKPVSQMKTKVTKIVKAKYLIHFNLSSLGNYILNLFVPLYKTSKKMLRVPSRDI